MDLFGTTIEVENLEAVLICMIAGIALMFITANAGIKESHQEEKRCMENFKLESVKDISKDICPENYARISFYKKWNIILKVLALPLSFITAVYLVRFQANR